MALKRVVTRSAMMSASSMSSLGCRLSGPHDLFMSIFLSTSKTISTVMMRSGIFSLALRVIPGMLPSGSCVKILENCYKRRLPFSISSNFVEFLSLGCESSGATVLPS